MWGSWDCFSCQRPSTPKGGGGAVLGVKGLYSPTAGGEEGGADFLAVGARTPVGD